MATPKTPAAAPSLTPDTASWQTAGRNVRYTTLEGMLFIAVPITDDAIKASPTSKSGKSKSVGSTEGNVTIAGTNVKMGVNVYTPV